MSRTIKSFVYEGRALDSDTNEEVTLPRQEFAVVEFFPREPSAYVQSPYWLVVGKDERGVVRDFDIDAGDLDEFEGRCADCQQKHDKGACHFDQEPPIERHPDFRIVG